MLGNTETDSGHPLPQSSPPFSFIRSCYYTLVLDCCSRSTVDAHIHSCSEEPKNVIRFFNPFSILSEFCVHIHVNLSFELFPFVCV
uniref:Uncharacterized protein n=1 Tax=Physcomitrium patens TaxID=3218 RepID=A0A7I4EWL0_PHYPA